MTTPDNETTGLELFDFTASAVGTFPKSFRGYDRRSVDAYVYDLEHKAIQAKREARDASSRAFRLEMILDSGDYSKLGGHTASILTAAEQQSSEIIQKAQLDAEKIVETALSEAQGIRLSVEESAQEARLLNLDAINRLRGNAETAANEELLQAQDQANAIREAADLAASQTRAQAKLDADLLIREGAAQALATKEQAKAEAANLIAKTLAANEEAQRETAAFQATSHAELTEMLANARGEAASFADQMAAQAQELAQLRQRAQAKADDILATALAESEALRVAGHQQATLAKDQADAYVYQEKAKLRREIERLTSRKEAIAAQLANLSALASLSMTQVGQRTEEVTAALELDGHVTPPEETTILHREEPDGA